MAGSNSFPNNGLGTVTGCSVDQGIYVGYLDIYSAALYGQWITLDSVCNGDYSVVSFTDPNNWILEMNDSNNWAAVPWTLTHTHRVQSLWISPTSAELFNHTHRNFKNRNRRLIWIQTLSESDKGCNQYRFQLVGKSTCEN